MGHGTDGVRRDVLVEDGIWLLKSGTQFVCGELSEEEQQLVWATAMPPVPDLFEQKVDGTAWRTKPSWAIIGTNDQTVHPQLERDSARRMRATTFELESSHVPMLSQPNNVLDIIRQAAGSL